MCSCQQLHLVVGFRDGGGGGVIPLARGVAPHLVPHGPQPQATCLGLGPCAPHISLCTTAGVKVYGAGCSPGHDCSLLLDMLADIAQQTTHALSASALHVTFLLATWAGCSCRLGLASRDGISKAAAGSSTCPHQALRQMRRWRGRSCRVQPCCWAAQERPGQWRWQPAAALAPAEPPFWPGGPSVAQMLLQPAGLLSLMGLEQNIRIVEAEQELVSKHGMRAHVG